MLIQAALLAAVQEQPLDVFTHTLPMPPLKMLSGVPLTELKDLLVGDIE
jgi:hypothetical protein